MKLLIIGGGIYVQGSDYNENGTIIPSVIESIKDKNIDQVCFVTTSNYSAKECVKKSKRYIRCPDIVSNRQSNTIGRLHYLNYLLQ